MKLPFEKLALSLRYISIRLFINPKYCKFLTSLIYIPFLKSRIDLSSDHQFRESVANFSNRFEKYMNQILHGSDILGTKDLLPPIITKQN